MESSCRQIRMAVMEQRFRDHPDFHRAKASLDQLTREIEGELGEESRVMGCYGETLDRLSFALSKWSMEEINERYAQLKSNLFSTSMAFFSSMSEQFKQYIRRVKARLRGLPATMKRNLLTYMQDLWIEKIHPMLQAFIDKIDKVAKQLKVDSYSVSLNYAFIEVSFSFKPFLKK